MTFPTRKLTDEQKLERLKEWHKEAREKGFDTITPNPARGNYEPDQ